MSQEPDSGSKLQRQRISLAATLGSSGLSEDGCLPKAAAFRPTVALQGAAANESRAGDSIIFGLNVSNRRNHGGKTRGI
jgi:hypothetical protein